MKLFDLTVGSYIQTLEAMTAFLSTSRKYFESEGVDLQEVIDSRLISDMQPFSFQILAVVVHSIETLKALESGIFDPEPPKHEPTFSGLEKLLKETLVQLEQYQRETVNSLEGIEIQIGQGKMTSAKDYLLSHNLPNFYFHAATAYDILRMKGAPIGKLDFLGTRRLEVE